MKTAATLAAFILLMGTSCKDNQVTTPEERMEHNHPPRDNSAVYDARDTTKVIKDSVIDHNMKGQDDTHGRDVQDGD